MAKKPVEKKRGFNKSRAIREYRDSHPEAKPTEIADHFIAKGYDISSQYVSTILSNAKRKEGFGDFGNMNLSAEDLMLVKQLVARLGGANTVKKAVDLYSQLTT